MAKVYRSSIQVMTRGPGHMVDLTGQIHEICGASGIRQGLVNVFVVGSTAAVGTIEFEPGLCQDLPDLLRHLIPPDKTYHHDATWHDGNGHSHLQATLLGPSLTIPVQDGKMLLGTWQQVFLLECDIRPRRRQVIVSLLGE